MTTKTSRLVAEYSGSAPGEHRVLEHSVLMALCSAIDGPNNRATSIGWTVPVQWAHWVRSWCFGAVTAAIVLGKERRCGV
jgi:hypothetical protein